MDGNDNPDEGQKNSGENSNPHSPSGTPESGGKTTPPEDPKSIAKETLQRVKMTEVLLVVLTGVIAASSVTTCYVYNRQLGVMQDTLDEIRVSGIDTHHLSSAMGRSAVATHGLVEQTTTLAEQTTSLATYAGKAAVAAEKSQAATEKLARATADAAAASHSLAESAGQSAAASQRLAAAANDANAVSRELVKTTQQVAEINQNAQRAFVFVKGVSIQKVSYKEWYRDLLESNGLPASAIQMPAGTEQMVALWKINLIWENSGSTPTKNMTISNSFWNDWDRKAEHPIDVSAIPQDDKLLVRLPDQKVFIGPKQSAPIPSAAVDLISLLFGALLAPQYYVFGTARYQDILNPSYVHRVDYCYFIHLTGDLAGASGLSGDKGREPLAADLQPCAKHNCMDEECDPKPPQPVTAPEPAKPPG